MHWIARLFVVVAVFTQCHAELPGLRVAANGRELETESGAPFLYIGDTAWELFHRLTREEAERYLQDRAKKGFTAIQAVALAEFEGLTEPNRYGELPLTASDPTKPRDEYFKHVDFIVGKAAQLGLYTALLPTWGDKVNKKWGKGPEIFTPENARVFGEWIARRYANQPIIWVLGGDRPVESPVQAAIWRAMAEGIRAVVGSKQLITYHPMGGRSSSEFVHAESWLDFNMMQSGHGARNAKNYVMIAKDLAIKPQKPTMDGEPAYEDHPVRGDKSKTQWFDQWDVRKLCYWGLFAGACGHTYGTHSIWAMWDGKSKKLADQRTPWPEAMALPGSAQVGYARRLLELRPLAGRLPDQALLAAEGEGAEHCQALRGADGSWAMIYSASGKPFTVMLGKLNGKKLRASWFDPREGSFAPGNSEMENKGEPTEFLPPTSGDGKDWVLVVDNVEKGYPVSGAAK